jgi:signal transduction histidine kinase
MFGEREICFIVHDDGCGFNPAGEYSGFGLRGMAERTEEMGGQLTIQSADSRGTTVSVTVPVPTSAQQESK